MLVPREYTKINVFTTVTSKVSCAHKTLSTYYLWFSNLALPKQYIGTDRQVDKIYISLELSPYLNNVSMEYKFKFKTDTNTTGVTEVLDHYRSGSLREAEVSLLDENGQLIYTNNDTHLDIYLEIHTVEGQALPFDQNEVLVKQVDIQDNHYEGADGFYSSKTQDGNKIVDVKAAFELVNSKEDVENKSDDELADIGKFNTYLYSGTAKHDPFTLVVDEQGNPQND